MLYIDQTKLVGKEFVSTTDPSNTKYDCIGYGQSPETGANYLVGARFDSANNRTEIFTILLKDIKILGN